MTPRERVLAALRREIPDRVPYHLSFTPPMQKIFQEKTGADHPAEYWNFASRHVRFYPPQTPDDYSRYYPDPLPDGAIIDPWGIAQVPGSMYHFTKMIHPLRQAQTVADIVDYPLPAVTSDTWQHLEGDVAALHARNLAAHGSMEMTVFELSWYLRGMENLFNDMIFQPDMAEPLLDRITALRVFQAETFARANVDILGLGDDISTQRGMLMSPAMWRQWFKSRLARVIEAARAIKPNVLIHYHTDGDCRAVIPELIEIGVDILNPIQPECMDPAAIKAQYGDRLAFSGTIGTQTTMPQSTPAEVKAAVKDRIVTVGQGGGLLLAPTHVLEPDVPWENVLAFIEAAEEYGRY
jgi:uroporphyrinogen decarboxylase